MTEADWLSHTDLGAMLEFAVDRVSERKHISEVPNDGVLQMLRSTDEGAEHLVRPANLLRGIVGNPFRPVAADPAWLAWNGGTLAQMARGIYEERIFGELPLLADALEESGCGDFEILSHCRTPGEHVRGCWILDLILGKE